MTGCLSCVEGILPPPGRPQKLTLRYFNIAGRAEPIRLALLLGKFHFEDDRFTGKEWEETHKKSTPYGQVPVLVVEQKQISQTKAILRYVGKLTKYEGHFLYPRDAYLAAKVDEILDAFDDLWILLAPTFRIKDQGEKENARRRLFGPGGEASSKVQTFESILKESPNGYVVPEAGLTVADLTYYGFLNMIRSGFIEGLTPELYKDYPYITSHKEKIALIPAIKEYYEGAKSNPSNDPHYEVFLPGK